MSDLRKHASKRFNATRWTERIVPLLLALLLVALLVTLVVVALSILGLTPGS